LLEVAVHSGIACRLRSGEHDVGRNRQEGRLRIGDRVFDTVSWKGPKQSTEMLEEVPFSGVLGDDEQGLQLSGRPD
jgi:hypothetical protein